MEWRIHCPEWRLFEPASWSDPRSHRGVAPAQVIRGRALMAAAQPSHMVLRQQNRRKLILPGLSDASVSARCAAGLSAPDTTASRLATRFATALQGRYLWHRQMQ